jgi:hypothetical protein
LISRSSGELLGSDIDQSHALTRSERALTLGREKKTYDYEGASLANLVCALTGVLSLSRPALSQTFEVVHQIEGRLQFKGGAVCLLQFQVPQ